jgi:hypothetical protein
MPGGNDPYEIGTSLTRQRCFFIVATAIAVSLSLNDKLKVKGSSHEESL